MVTLLLVSSRRTSCALPHSGLGASCQYTVTLEFVFLYRSADQARPLPAGLDFTTGRVRAAPNALVDGGAVGAGVRCAGPDVRSGGPGVRCAGKAVSAAGVHPAMTQTAAKRTGINVNFTATSFQPQRNCPQKYHRRQSASSTALPGVLATLRGPWLSRCFTWWTRSCSRRRRRKASARSLKNAIPNGRTNPITIFD